MNKTISQLEKLKEQRAKLAARIQAIEARAKTSKQKQETRRKILVGAYYLDEAIKNNQLDDIRKKMESYLTRNSDRSLFELPELVEQG
jgi:large subunit ribosomal protein L7/L12